MWHERRRIHIETKNLPLVVVLNKGKFYCGISLLELCFCGIAARNDFPGFWCDGDTGLSKRWLAFLKVTEAREPLKHLIELLLCNRFLELGTRTSNEFLLAPAGDDSGNDCVSVGPAFFVERIAAHCDEANADCTEHDDKEEDYSKNGEELFHTRGMDLTRERDKPRQGAVANTLKLLRNGDVGFIDWLGLIDNRGH